MIGLRVRVRVRIRVRVRVRVRIRIRVGSRLGPQEGLNLVRTPAACTAPFQKPGRSILGIVDSHGGVNRRLRSLAG